jgi:hypothetical protein
VSKELGAWRKRHVIDIAVQRLVHAKNELRHIGSLLACELYHMREELQRIAGFGIGLPRLLTRDDFDVTSAPSPNTIQ